MNTTYQGAALQNQVVDPREHRFVCRCHGVSRTAAEVATMSVPLAQDFGDGDVIALHTCPGCGCTFGLPWTAPVRPGRAEVVR